MIMITKQDGYMVINLATAECELGFQTREQAEQFIKETNIPEFTQDQWESYQNLETEELTGTLIMPYFYNNTEEPNELTIYSNTDKTSKFSSVAEYYEDTLNEDFISTQDTPVRIGLA